MPDRDATITVDTPGGTTQLSTGAVGDRRSALIGRLEGRHISVTLTDGSDIDDYELVSAGHHGVQSLWLCANGADMFVPLAEVADVREVPGTAADGVQVD